MIADRAARELHLFIENDGLLYRQQYQPIIKNLMTKKARGQYKHDLAVKAFGYLVESGAKKYAKDFGSPTQPWHKMFDVAARKDVSEELARDFETEAALGNYDSLLPKKYQKQGTTAHARRRAPWMLEHSQHEAERKAREKTERTARGNRLYAVLAWRPDGRYSGKDVWRWFKREADAERWARGINQGHGVAVREYTALNDANAEWIPERAARLVADFAGAPAEHARHHATKKSSAQLDREIASSLSRGKW